MSRTALEVVRTWSQTRVRVRQLRTEFPTMTAARIARLVGVSRERVRQALVAEGLPTRVPQERRGGWQARRVVA